MKARFLAKVKKHKNGCWLWTGSISRNGYGRFALNKRNATAHRVSYELFVAKIPTGLCSLHKCDNRKCVNPDHLFLGTYKDNAVDRESKNRSRSHVGIYNNTNKLTVTDVKKIRKLLAKAQKLKDELSFKYTHKVIAKMFNVSTGAIACIHNGKNWRHV